MKLSASVMAKLCGVALIATGCETVDELRAQRTTPVQPVVTEQAPVEVEVWVGPSEQPAPARPAFAQPPPAKPVAKKKTVTPPLQIQPPTHTIQTTDPCPACGMG